jgi:predicted nucleic-acid-binding protein
MIGLDANILVRYIVQDDAAQAAAATALIEGECTAENPAWVDCVVLCELVWVLESAYDFTRATVVEVLRTMLTSAELRIEASDMAWSALRSYQNGGVDFADCLIGLRNRQAGCETTATFDKRAGRMATHRLQKT